VFVDYWSSSKALIFLAVAKNDACFCLTVLVFVFPFVPPYRCVSHAAFIWPQNVGHHVVC
jgi:hypothetical protein